MKVVIAEDDISSRKLLSLMIQKLPEYTIVGQASNGDELIKLVMSDNPDIILVDISMPGLDGVEAAKSCKELFPQLQVIFTTGHDDYAVDAFNLSAVDYLIKPIELKRLKQAMEKAKVAIELNEPQYFSNIRQNKLAFKSKNTIVYVFPDDILFVERNGKKTIIYTKMDEIEVTEPLHIFEERLPNNFIKTHRSYLVNLNKITRIESVGETYHAYFNPSEKFAHISKLKIHDVYKMFGTNQ